jgi:hypothetical protein
VTCGLHAASLAEDNGLRVDQVFAETDVAVMHAYSMYIPLARHPLDPDLVPFGCALTAALCGKPVLMEEFGGCTAPPGQPSCEWQWRSYGLPRTQFMASEEDYAAYLEASLPKLVQVGALGALVWCFADYIPELWNLPPCKESRHERFFGLVRPDGLLKPHAQVLKVSPHGQTPIPAWPPGSRQMITTATVTSCDYLSISCTGYMTTRLIINSVFGAPRSLLGIRQAHLHNIVTSSTASEHAAWLRPAAFTKPQPGIGVHWC